MISLQQVRKVYDGQGPRVVALDDVSLEVARGEFVAVVGPSGSGKSTLLQILGCLDVPTAGRYVLDGREVSTLDDDALSAVRNATIGFVFQSFNLIPRTTARENVETPLLYARGPAEPGRVDAAMAQAAIAHRASHYPDALSGGEQQRVAIARALVNRPALLIADEPTGNLDERTGREILDVLASLNAAGLTIVMVTHDPAVARAAHRVVSVVDGVLTGTAGVARAVAQISA
ncbi:MAG TPA: ABC transporter ATP-binding protein [Gemmatirosa sp.]